MKKTVSIQRFRRCQKERLLFFFICRFVLRDDFLGPACHAFRVKPAERELLGNRRLGDIAVAAVERIDGDRQVTGRRRQRNARRTVRRGLLNDEQPRTRRRKNLVERERMDAVQFQDVNKRQASG